MISRCPVVVSDEFDDATPPFRPGNRARPAKTRGATRHLSATRIGRLRCEQGHGAGPSISSIGAEGVWPVETGGLGLHPAHRGTPTVERTSIRQPSPNTTSNLANLRELPTVPVADGTFCSDLR